MYSDLKGQLFYVADFYCAKHKLIIELDGDIHKLTQGYDLHREMVLTEMGYNIIRFKNVETSELPKFLKELESFIESINM